MSHPGEPPSTDEQVMALLHDHVPLTLLVDLVDAPASEQVLAEEGLPDKPWWEPSPTDRAALADAPGQPS